MKLKKELEAEVEQLRFELEQVRLENRQLRRQVSFLVRSSGIKLEDIDPITELPHNQSAPPGPGPGHSYLKGTDDPWN